MMTQEIYNILQSQNIQDVTSAEEFFKKIIRDLQKSGRLALGEDKDLSGFSLELRVFELFSRSGFQIAEGRPGMEDFIITPLSEDEISRPLVIEVKSSKSPQPNLADLRQLDDWVFDLSGEERARKDGLGGGVDPLATISLGFSSSPRYHPSPHKGVFVFNGQIGTPFEDRTSQILHSNQLDFALKRNFCVLRLDRLKALLNVGRDFTWKKLHETVGEVVL